MRSRLIRFLGVTLLFFLFLAWVIPVRADIAGDLSDFWDDLGGTVNRTPGTAFSGQSAGYYTFGNLRARSPSRNSQVFTISPPGFAAGCGGIDMFAGSLSFISKDELIQLSRAIAANGVGYAFDLALETISPVIAETMKDLRARLQELNLNNINSCETAQGLVDSALGRDSLNRNKLCQRIGTVKGLFTDYSDARQECGRSPDAHKDARDSVTDAEKDALPENVNLAWHVMRGETRIPASDWLRSDDELAELAMTLTGTVIFREDGEKDFLEPMILGEDVFDALYDGGSLRYYKCTGDDATDKCLNVTRDNQTISDDDSFRGRVETAFNALQENIRTNTPPSDDHVALINGTSIPIWRMLNVYAAYAGPIIDTQRGPIIDAVANDIMLAWIEGMVNEVNRRARSSELSGYDQVEEWKQDLTTLRSIIIEKRIKTSQKFDQTMQLIERIRLIEESLSARVAGKAGAGYQATATGGTRE